jgi:hypothetical protein
MPWRKHSATWTVSREVVEARLEAMQAYDRAFAESVPPYDPNAKPQGLAYWLYDGSV